MNKYDIQKIKEKALKQFKTGKSLFGKDGAFAPLLQNFIQEALEAEMEDHLSEEERKKGNKRNGRGEKSVKSASGDFKVYPPEDRLSTYTPQTLQKRQTILADTLEEKIIGLYGLGTSSRDIADHIKEMYDTSISHTTLMAITDRIIPLVKDWQNRTLDNFYPIVFLDAHFNKIKENGTVKNRATYSALAINKEGKKEVLGIYTSKEEGEGASFWLSVLTQLQNRGLQDILIVCTDNLKGFDQAIKSIFPKAEIQTCVIHQVRHSIKYISYKDKKEFMADLKKIYKASTKEKAEQELLELEEKWGEKYPVVIKSWLNNWDKLSTYFDYTEPIRKIIYTTNMIEGYHRQLRRVTKNKGVFPNEMALLKLLFLATKNIEKKWTKPIPNWCLVTQQLCIKFGDRMILDLKT